MNHSGERKRRPGPQIDAVVRAMVESHVAESVRWFVAAAGQDPPDPTGIKPEPARFAITNSTREADFLAWSAPGRLLQVEFETSPRRGLALRMLEYRHLIMRAHPEAHLTQLVLVLGRGRVDNRDDPIDGGYRLGLTTVRVLDLDPAEFLETPGLEALTMLTRRARADPEAAFNVALGRIRRRTEPGAHPEEVGILMTLAAKSLTVTTMEKLMKEAMLDNREILRQMREAPLASQLLREAEEQGREQVYADMLELRFGEHDRIPAVARALASLPRAEAKRAVLAAASIEDLPTA